MGSSTLTVAQTVAEVVKRRPVLEPVLRAFEPLFAAREALVAELAEPLRTAGVKLPEFQRERSNAGVPMMADMSLTGTAAAIRISAEHMLPLLAKQEAVAPHISKLESFFFHDEQEEGIDKREQLAEIMVGGSTDAFAQAAEQCDVPPAILDFVAGFVFSPVLRALAAQAEDAPWDEEGIWRQGYCPVCGDFPSIGWLDARSPEEKNSYMSGGGGKKHLHCDRCGTNWKFRRGACPACGAEEKGVMEFLRESKGGRGERLDWCTQCKAYCPVVDLRERDYIPDMDAMALGMIHLDLAASHRELKPIRPSFWNMF